MKTSLSLTELAQQITDRKVRKEDFLAVTRTEYREMALAA